jgi:hypothetical protein
MPRPLFTLAFLLAFAMIAESGMLSIRPAPYVGVGMRNTTLFLASCVS